MFLKQDNYFVLESILESNHESLRKKELEFAFRVFSARIVELILEISGSKIMLNTNLTRSALLDNKTFTNSLEEVNIFLRKKEDFIPNYYNEHYLDIAIELRNLSKDFIRIYSSNKQEMMYNFRRIQELASNWNYKSQFEKSRIQYINSLDHGDSEKEKLQKELDEKIEEAWKIMIATNELLLDLMNNIINNKGMSLTD